MSEDTNVEQSTDVDQLGDGLQNRADADQPELLGPDGPLTELTQRVPGRALMPSWRSIWGMGSPTRLGAGRAITAGASTEKTVLTRAGAVPVTMPRDREGSFAPQLVPKHARRLARSGEQILLALTGLYCGVTPGQLRAMEARPQRSHDPFRG